MEVTDNILARARLSPRTIVLPESEDIRILQAALKASKEGIARIILVGTKDHAINLLQGENGEDLELIEFIDPVTSPLRPELAQRLFAKRKHKGMTLALAETEILDPLRFSHLLVDLAYADGCVAGAVYTTADVVRSAIQSIGLSAQSSLVSSFNLMIMCQPFHQYKGGIIFSDCGLVIEPSERELADIAIAAAKNAKTLLQEEAKVAMLSFSTHGSARHPNVDKVVNAIKLVKSKAPELIIDQEVQLDAAIVSSIANIKAPDSTVKGKANVLIFPNLEAGNISYKLAERMAQATAIGPLLQGLAKPANDLSRGCSMNDVYLVIAVTVLQAQSQNL